MPGAQARRQKNERSGPGSSSDSNSGSAPGSQTGRTAAVSSGRFDGNRDPETTGDTATASSSFPPTLELSNNVKNLDIGGGNMSMVRGHKVDLVRRPAKPTTLGREIMLALNTFSVLNLPSRKVYSYQVLVGSGAEKRGLIKKAFHSSAVQAQLPNAKGWIFDGNALAWSTDKVAELRVQVDLDAEQGRKPRADQAGKNTHRVIIKQTRGTGYVDFASLDSYLNGRADFNNQCLEAITFADHLMREWPSQSLTQIKRSFFQRGQDRHVLGGGVEAFKGVYQSMRIARGPDGGGMLTVNVDVSNGTFFTSGLLQNSVIAITNVRGEAEIGLIIKRDDKGRHNQKFNELKRLRKLHVYAAHRGQTDKYVIDRFLDQDSTDFKFEKNGKMVTLLQYFKDTHQIKLQWPNWPVVKMTSKKAVLPLELLKLDENQRYPFKLDDRQTASMIKVAVTAPKDRWRDVEHGLSLLKWNQDPYLKNYGMEINPKETVIKGRLLQNPKLQFGGGSGTPTDPRTTGRWDLKGKKFLTPNTANLKSWGVCFVTGRSGNADKPTVDRFIAEFVKVYISHGGKVDNKIPDICMSPSYDPGKCVELAWNSTGNRFKTRPQILVFILPDKDSIVYGRIKRSCECRYGVVSQCMQYAHVQKCQPQYISNVCMKFNAKLGGVTNRAIGPTSTKPTGVFSKQTVVIGCDVSHAAPGSQKGSMAAMTVSTDLLATRYAAACEVNGYRVEMVTPENIRKLLAPLLKNWVQTVNQGRFPQQIIYFRDGVSEGQFSQVLEQEVTQIKAMLKGINPATEQLCKFVVIVASKRHHIRFFPRPGDPQDRNGNALPGTLIETGVTHPFENDFYLCAHAAIKGTARPVHYNVLLNESGITQDEIYTLIYEHSYQYIRATTPVSIFPAVYYAHIASNRAIHHDKDFGGANSAEKVTLKQGGQGPEGSKLDQTKTSATPNEFEPLMQMPDLNNTGINTSMWYI